MNPLLKIYLKELAGLQSEVSFNNYWKIIEHDLIEFVKNNPSEKDYDVIEEEVRKIYRSEFRNYSIDLFDKYNVMRDLVNDIYKDMGGDLEKDFERVIAIERSRGDVQKGSVYVWAWKDANILV